MTKPRFDSHSTEFGLWLREQPEIDSSLGYITTNLDYVWFDFRTKQVMIIEEKRYGSDTSRSQRQVFELLNAAMKTYEGYRGIHLLRFENTSPEDGQMRLNGKSIDKETLIKFLMFDKDILEEYPAFLFNS